MKVCKKYLDLVNMYYFNPINECELFENMESQYLYSEGDEKKEEMYQYVYWYEVDYEMLKNKSENKIFKRVVLNKNSLLIENGYCIVPEGVTSIGDCCFSHCS